MKKSAAFFALLMILTATVLPAQNNLPYLGQDPPGMTAKRFPPDSLLGNSSWWWHGSPIFTPDGLDMFWTEYVRYSPTNENAALFNMFVDNNSWGAIHHPTFANLNYFENNPVLSPGGDTLYFFSTRPGGPYFRTVRSATGWSLPSAVPIPVPAGSGNGLQFAVNRNGDFYIEVSIPPSAPPDLYISRFVNGVHQMAVKLGPEINSDYLDAFPFVDPDEEYLIFASNRPGGFGGQFDNYICFKNPGLSWSQAINMGHEINSAGAWFATVTHDKQYLFFNSWKPGDHGYNPYWISAAVIDSLRTIVGVPAAERIPVAVVVDQNQPNPFRGETRISFSLSEPQTVTLTISDLFGKCVATLINNQQTEAGRHMARFAPEQLEFPDGVYFYSLRTEKTTIIKKMVRSSNGGTTDF